MLLLKNLKIAAEATKKNRPVCSTIPKLNPGRWGFTTECCLNYQKSTAQAVREVYYSLSGEEQYNLTFPPIGEGAWLERALFWKSKLADLPPEQYHDAITQIIAWCIRGKKGDLLEEARNKRNKLFEQLTESNQLFVMAEIERLLVAQN